MSMSDLEKSGFVLESPQEWLNEHYPTIVERLTTNVYAHHTVTDLPRVVGAVLSHALWVWYQYHQAVAETVRNDTGRDAPEVLQIARDVVDSITAGHFRDAMAEHTGRAGATVQ